MFSVEGNATVEYATIHKPAVPDRQAIRVVGQSHGTLELKRNRVPA